MSQVPDRKKLRRDYLRKKRRLNTAQIVGFVVLLASAILPVAAVLTVLILFRSQLNLLYTATIVASLVLWLLLLRWGWRALMEVERRERTLPYVPPMTPDSLPANEVLVRGAQQPEAAHHEVLLRAARGGETPAEELLRITTSPVDPENL